MQSVSSIQCTIGSKAAECRGMKTRATFVMFAEVENWETKIETESHWGVHSLRWLLYDDSIPSNEEMDIDNICTAQILRSSGSVFFPLTCPKWNRQRRLLAIWQLQSTTSGNVVRWWRWHFQTHWNPKVTLRCTCLLKMWRCVVPSNERRCILWRWGVGLTAIA